MEKRIYAIDKVTYLKAHGFTTYDIKVDVIDNKKIAYYVFPQTKEIADIINQYNKDIKVKKINSQYKDTKREIREALK